MSAGLDLIEVTKSFGRQVVLHDISFSVEPGEILALLGPSGCGKSTLLSLIAGLEKADSGVISWDGLSLADVPPHQRSFGLMFQDLALFPHLDVFANIAFGLRMSGLSPDDVSKTVTEMLDLVGLTALAHRDVATLSGGEQQRIALARSLAPRPRLLMLDEPLGSLDRILRERLVLELHRILKEIHQTAIYVTHDQEEAFMIADCIAIMHQGRIEQVGRPQEIYRRPASPFTARFLGLNNLVQGVIEQEGDGKVLSTPFGRLPYHGQALGEVTVLLRPDAASLDKSSSLRLSGKVVRRIFRGALCQLEIESLAGHLTFDFDSDTSFPEESQIVELNFDPAGIQVIADNAP